MKWLVPTSQKLVAFLQAQLGDEYSGKFLRRLLELNLCRINGRVERFGSSMVQKGAYVELSPNWKTLLAPKPAVFQTLYEDEFFKIVDKPAGWVCAEKEATLAFGPKHYLAHRLDKDTTGLLLVAKSPLARDKLMELFEKREIAKSYLALVDGVPRDKSGVRKSFLAKKGAFQGQTIWGSSAQGLTAITHWKLLSSGKNAALIHCEPETGRTHQIRVHLSEMGHPILVDRQYAKTFRCSVFVQRYLLHAYRLKLVHPFTGVEIDLKAVIPSDFSETAQSIGLAIPNC